MFMFINIDINFSQFCKFVSLTLKILFSFIFNKQSFRIYFETM